MTGDAKPSVLIRTPFNEGQSQFSPDGRWIAYTSDESGRLEVYVQSFQGTQGKWQISTQGGSEPRWSPNGRELYYVAADQKLVAVPIDTGDPFTPGVPVPLFNMRIDPVNARNDYDVAPDGRFLFVQPDEDTLTPTTIVMNWRAGSNQR
jgi:Tol biopolymer transport system component